MNLIHSRIYWLLISTAIFLFLIPKDSKAQIKWYPGESMDMAYAKAKKENKLIFIDCYATWCGPCKQMDQQVFSKSEIFEVINRKFIPIKLQMDKTSTDDNATKKSYASVAYVSREYGIPAYPTYFVLNSQRKVIARWTGVRSSEDVLKFFEDVLNPNYVTPFSQYYLWLDEFNKGIRDKKKMPLIADTALQLRQKEVALKVSKEYKGMLNKMNVSEWFIGYNLTFITKFLGNSKDTFFNFVLNNRNTIDSILAKPGYSDYVIGKIIQDEIVRPYTNVSSEMKIPKNQDSIIEIKEPDWDLVASTLNKRFDPQLAEASLLKGKVDWYAEKALWPLCAMQFTILIKKFPPKYLNSEVITFLNQMSWSAIFQRSVDRNQIDIATFIMERAVQCARDLKITWYDGIDTYANLLYKSGKRIMAIQVQEKAISENENYKRLDKNIKSMLVGVPTWPYNVSNDETDPGMIEP